MSNFYTVKFQFPLAWKVFLATSISLIFAIASMPNLRKAIYQVAPVKTLAIILNSSTDKEYGTSVVDLLESENSSIYSLDKYKIVKFSQGVVTEAMTRDQLRSVSGGRMQSMNSLSEIDQKLFIGTWNGAIISNVGGNWQKVYQAKEKVIISGVFKHADHYYALSSKGVFVLNEEFKLIKRLLKEEYIEEHIICAGKVYILSRKKLLQFKNKEWVTLHNNDRELYISKIATVNNSLALLTSKGLRTIDDKGQISNAELTEYSIDNFAANSNFQAVYVYKKGLFLRKFGEEWVHFPPPGKNKSRCSSMIIKDGTLWASFYGSGLYQINFKRLLELENSL